VSLDGPYPGDAEFSKGHGKAGRATIAGSGFRTAYTVPFSARTIPASTM